MFASIVAAALALPSSQVPDGLAGAPPRLTAARASAAVALDGRLDDPAWAAAPVSDAFTQQYPKDGVKPNERTEVRILYDDRSLFVGIRCFQSTPPVALLTRRDRVVPSDRVTVDISSRADRLTAFHFGVNAAGVLEDGLFFDDASYSADWDENWEARTFIDADGWSAELRLPLRILRFDAAPKQVWGLQVQRYTEATHEWDLWAYRARGVAGYVSSFGVVDGLEGLRPSRPFELRWSEVLRYRHRALDVLPSPSAPEHDWDWTFSLDAKTHPTQGTTLDLTLNPDFGQVEADQVVLNLSNYEVFYPEKRPFFLEGIDTFSTPRTVLYTRRIGARPATPTLGDDERLIDQLEPSKIWGAAKLVGAVTRRTSVGLLTALTGRNSADIERKTADGITVPDSRTSRLADPWALFNVLRLRRQWGQGIDVGLLATAVNRFEQAGQSRLTNDAYVTAVDGHWHSPSADYLVSGQVLATMLGGGPGRTAPDGITTRPGQPSTGATVSLAKQGGGSWLMSTTQSFSGRQLDYNDVGYLDRKNDYNAYADVAYRTLHPWRGTTDTTTSLAASHRQSLKGLSFGDNLRLQTGATFQNFWAVTATAYYHSAFYDDRETRDGTALQRASLVGAELWVGADSRRKLTGAAWVQVQSLANGIQIQGNAALIARPTPRLELEIDPTALYTSGEPRFIVVPSGGSTYYFGRLRATNLGVTVRATVGLLPTLTFQLYSQLFMAAKHFSSFSTATGGGEGSSIRLSDLVPIGEAAPLAKPNPDSQTAVLNVNAVLRWEYRLGSVVYLVYTRAQSPSLDILWPEVPRLDAGSLRGNRGSVDAILLKASYWWG